MPNTILTSDLVTKDTSLEYKNSMKFAGLIDNQYNDQFKYEGGTTGDTVSVRLPVRFAVTEGQAFQQQPIIEAKVPVTLEKQFNVGMGWSSAQRTTDISEVRKRYIRPAAVALANKVDVYAFQKVYLDVYTAVGTPGTTPSAALTYQTAVAKLYNQAVDGADLKAVLSPISMVTLANAQAALFNPASDISEQYRKGMQAANTLGVAEWWMEQNCQPYTTGTFAASTPLVNGASQTGSSLITDGWASGATSLAKGDVFTIGGVYTVNPVSYTNTGQLQDFVVTAAVSDTSGDMTISISPSIITSGPLQTVSNSPANNAVITVKGATSASGGTLAATTTVQNLIFRKEFAALVHADLAMPEGGADGSRVSDPAFGISIRLAKQYDISNDQNPSRLDVLVGAAIIQPRLAARIYS